MKVVSAQPHSMLPESVRNIIESVNCASRIILKGCEGTERAVDGLDEIATISLQKQRQRLLLELEST